MTPIYVYDDPVSDRYVIFRGRGARSWLVRAGVPAYRSAVNRGHAVRRDRLPDLLARADADGLTVHVRTGVPR